MRYKQTLAELSGTYGILINQGMLRVQVTERFSIFHLGNSIVLETSLYCVTVYVLTKP